VNITQDQTLHYITLNKINNKKIDKLELSHDCFTIRILIAIAINTRAVQLMEAAKVKKGSGEPNRAKVASVTWEQVRAIAVLLIAIPNGLGWILGFANPYATSASKQPICFKAYLGRLLAVKIWGTFVWYFSFPFTLVRSS
jgi:hypothetical protein